MEALVAVHACLAGFFAFAAIHYAVHWCLSSRERGVLAFSLQCALYAIFCGFLIAFSRATTVHESQSALTNLVTTGALVHAVVLEFYAGMCGRRGRRFRALVTGLLVILAVVNQVEPLRGHVLELREVSLPGSGAKLLFPIRTPPGVLLVLLYGAVLAVYGYGFFAVREFGKRDRVGAFLVAIGTTAVLLGAAVGALVDFAHVRMPYAGAMPHAIFVLFAALFLSREYASRGRRLAASERVTARSLGEARRALAALQAEQRRLEEVEVARQRALQALVEAQRKELASELAAGLAHDFKNVLNVMSLWSAVLLRSSEVDKSVAEKAIADAEKQGRALTRQLVALARPGARSVTKFPLARPVATTVQTLKPALPKTVGLSVESRQDIDIDVEADEAEMQQVIYNLVLNARDAMPRGGSIVVRVGLHTTTTATEVIGGALAAGRWATLSVSDTGTGIDPAIRERIFDVFFTTKGPERGTGLGLATVLRIARVSGGGVALETEVGRGATFSVYMPAA